MVSVLFEDVNGVPVARLIHSRDGTTRAADGERFFDLAQAAARWQRPEADMLELYTRSLDDFAQPADDGAADIDIDDGLRLLWQNQHPDLTESEFRKLAAEAQRLGLSLWAKQLRATRTERNELRFFVPLEGLRLLAERTGQRGGYDAPTFDYGDDPRIPAKVSLTIYRSVKGRREAFTAVVLWDEAADERSSDLILRKPHLFMDRWAEAAALRKAFPEILGGLYSEDERWRDGPSSPRGSGGRDPDPARDATAAKTFSADGIDDAPESRFRFELTLCNLGVTDVGRRNEVIEWFRQQNARLAQFNPTAFYSLVVREVKRDTARYADPNQPLAQDR